VVCPCPHTGPLALGAALAREATLPGAQAGTERLGVAAAADGATVVDEHRHGPGRHLDVGAQPYQRGVAPDRSAAQRKAAAVEALEIDPGAITMTVAE
jgi:hypothetical protein